MYLLPKYLSTYSVMYRNFTKLQCTQVHILTSQKQIPSCVYSQIIVCSCVPLQHYQCPYTAHSVVITLLYSTLYSGHSPTRNLRRCSELVSLPLAPSHERYPYQTSLVCLLCSTTSSCRPKHKITSM